MNEQKQDDLLKSPNEQPSEGNTSNEEKKEKKDKNILNKILTIILIILILIMFILLGARYKELKDSGQDFTIGIPKFDLTLDKDAQEGGIEGKTAEEIQAELNKQVADGMINISMNMNPYVQGTTSNFLIVNETQNRYPQIVEVYLVHEDEENELIYRSGLIPVGNKVEIVTIDKTLETGDYDAIAYFNAIDEETGNLIGKAAAKLLITVVD